MSRVTSLSSSHTEREDPCEFGFPQALQAFLGFQTHQVFPFLVGARHSSLHLEIRCLVEQQTNRAKALNPKVWKN